MNMIQTFYLNTMEFVRSSFNKNSESYSINHPTKFHSLIIGVIVVFYLQRYVLNSIVLSNTILKIRQFSFFTKAIYKIISVIEFKLSAGQGGVNHIDGHLTENKMQMKQKDLTSKAPLKLHFS